MKYKILSVLTLAMSLTASQAATITVNTADNADFSAGKTNLVYALTNINDGDTINFNITGAGPHYLQTPAGGYPVLIKDRVTINGYSQPGAVANSNPITASNNAAIKIVLDSRNGNYRVMEYTAFTPANSSPPIDNTASATERGGYGDTEVAILGIYRATNVNVRGLAFLSDEFTGTGNSTYCIAVAHDYGGDTTVKDRLAYSEGSSRNCHINGCWFGIDPTNQTLAGITRPAVAVAFFRHRDANPPVVPIARPELPNEGLIFGVAPGSANPRAEFNVSPYLSYVLAGEGIRYRISGNFIGVLPDGTTPTDKPATFDDGIEIGRYDDTEPLYVGTDGDGVNDADEGNLFGPLTEGENNVFGPYGLGNKFFVVSGNRYGIAVNGTRWTNSQNVIGDSNIGSTAKLQFGSDFNGVSDAAEANIVYNNNPFSTIFPNPGAALAPVTLGADAGARVSVRGNVFVNNGLVPFDYARAGSTLQPFTNYSAPYMSTNAAIIPELSTNSTAADIIGVCASTNGGIYSNIIVDVYVLDPEGWTNGMAFNLPELNGTNGIPQGRAYLGSFVDNGPADRDPAVAKFNFGAGALNIPSGTQITVTANYSADPPGTTRGRTHTSNFSNPVTVRVPVRITSVSRSGTTLTINWSGGTGPYTLQKANTITGGWSNVTTGIAGTSTSTTITGTEGYFRVLGN